MARVVVTDDIDATAELPVFDMHILSTQLERVDLYPQSAPPPAASPDWRTTDQIAALRDQIESLKAALHDEHHRHARLSTRHQSLLEAMQEREGMLGIMKQQIISLEETILMLKRELAHTANQRYQREQFILKQAEEIKRLREQR